MEERKLFALKGRYLVTPWGDIYKLYKNKGLRKLNPSRHRNGYLLCSINGKNKLVHRIVAEALIPNPENKPEVDHINAIRDDNRVTNLRWVTRSENHKNVITMQNTSKVMTNGPCAKKVYQYTLDGKYIREWPSLNEVQRVLGFFSTAIGRCCRGKTGSAYGFIWSYSPLS